MLFPVSQKICVRETALKRGALVSNDAFILDRGTKIFQVLTSYKISQSIFYTVNTLSRVCPGDPVLHFVLFS